MANRRSLSAALELSDEKMAFIQSGPTMAGQTQPATNEKSKPQTSEVVASAASSEQENSSAVSIKQPARRERSRKQAGHLLPQEDESIIWISNLLVPLTTRLQPTTAAALKRAGLEQKLRGRNPGTVQEIAEAAIQQWLREFGYLE